MLKLQSIAKALAPTLLATLCLPTLTAATPEVSTVFGDASGVRVISRDEILNSGARTLGELLSFLPGVRLAADHSRSFPSSGAIVSADGGTQLGAGQFSRVLILFKGHSLNKAWFGGADQDFNTGFLEGLKEVRVYTGPAAVFHASGGAAWDTVIDMIPVEGKDLGGRTAFTVGASKNLDRMDRSLVHLQTGDRWGQDGQATLFGDFTRWNGEDIRTAGSEFRLGDRLDHKNPTWQLGGLVQKGDFEFMARHLQESSFDPSYCGRTWGYTFVEASETYNLPDTWRMKVTLGGDHIVSRWGLASSATSAHLGAWDQVTENRANFSMDARGLLVETSLRVVADFRGVWLDGGPDFSTNASQSVMAMHGRQKAAGLTLDAVHPLLPELDLEGAIRAEKDGSFHDVMLTPSAALLYHEGRTQMGLRYAEAKRPMDLWYRFGSGTQTTVYVPYVAAVELKPERNQQLKAWWDQRAAGGSTFHLEAFGGRYSDLLGFDWTFAKAQSFAQVRARSLGGYSYSGLAASWRLEGEHAALELGASSVSAQSDKLTGSQNYLTPGGELLYLSPTTFNVGLDWKPRRDTILTARYLSQGGAKNGGVDLTSSAFASSYNTGAFQDAGTHGTLDLSMRLLELWRHWEMQVTAHNATNAQEKAVLINGGFYTGRGREVSLYLRRTF